MPSLICSAQGCVYNHAMYCGRDDITITGEHAERCRDTCCACFCERKRDSMRSSVGTPGQRTEIDCKVNSCMYRDPQTCRCRADKVDVTGAGACDCCDTECVTFRKK